MKYENDTFAEIVDMHFLGHIFNGSNFNEIKENIRLFKMFDEPYKFITTSIETFHRGYLTEVLEKFILEAHQHGILEYLHRRVYKYGDIKEEIESSPQVLTMYMLSAGLCIWLGAVFVACLAFIGENIIFQIR